MIQSMTGFATKALLLTGKDGSRSHITLTIKSLNSRFLEVTSKLPFSLNHIETDLIKRFKKALHRGHIIFTVQMSNPNVFKGPIEPDLPTIKSYLRAIETIQKECTVEGNITVSELLRLPNIFSIEEQTIDEESKKFIFDAVDALIAQLIETRNQEGNALQKDLEHRVQELQKNITYIEDHAQSMMKRRKKEIQEKLSQLASEESQDIVDTQRHAFYLELDKADIHEEIVRFKSHLKTFAQHIAGPEQEKGRRLDFILQELGREANTIAAKSSDSEVSSAAINIKVELEKAREQVQNIV